MEDLFPKRSVNEKGGFSPLAERMRPVSLEQVAGQKHLLGEEKLLTQIIRSGSLPSLILWGPPGCGKTTLARLLSKEINADFVELSAVSSGVKEVRSAIERGQRNIRHFKKRTLLFIDEIHRFNKAQQDALLHSVEDGSIILVGATTENPSFEVIAPLLSRCRTLVLEPLGADDLRSILHHTLANDIILSKITITFEDMEFLFYLSGGDARKLLNGLEQAVHIANPDEKKAVVITNDLLRVAFQRSMTLYDKQGDKHYDIVSAFIKSVRGSDPDAAMYWLARMLEGGEDPLFIARRLIILASEDIGNADPHGLPLAVACFQSVHSIGMPESRIILAQTTAYLSTAPKSNSSYRAIDDALEDVRTKPQPEVPLHLRNAPTKLMENLGYGKEYLYAHDHPGHFVDQAYLPEGWEEVQYYKPTDQGMEKHLKMRLSSLWKKRKY